MFNPDCAASAVSESLTELCFGTFACFEECFHLDNPPEAKSFFSVTFIDALKYFGRTQVLFWRFVLNVLYFILLELSVY